MNWMKIPYGIADFELMRKGKYLYIDKTHYIERLEQMSNYQFFIRPRRFGKTLFISTLKNYYDLNQKDEFTDLFSGLYIGENPTESRNKFFILSLNFSGLNTDSQESLKSSFRKAVLTSLIKLLNSYRSFFAESEKIIDKLENESDLKRMLEMVFHLVEETNIKIFVLIDEYDHFANDIIAMGENRFYRDIVRARGFVRDFYETLKIGTESVIERIFMTGISPIMLDDLTSGFNITENLTMEESLNEILGFTHQEVYWIAEKICFMEEELTTNLAEYYNGYLFSVFGKERIYNPDMVLYFFKKYQQNRRPPVELIDDNVKTDYGRLQRLISNEKNKEILEKIIVEEMVIENLVTRFSFDRMYDSSYFVSLLFYLGLLTIDREEQFKLILKIPNYVIKTIFWGYIKDKFIDDYGVRTDMSLLNDAISELAFTGDVRPYIEYISQNILKQLSNRDLQEFDEKYIKIILFSYLATTRAYKTYSEREIEDGFIDIFLERDIRSPKVKYEWIWELKYVKKSEAHKLESVREKGIQQLNKYAKSRKFADKDNLKKALLIFIGKDEYQVEVL